MAIRWIAGEFLTGKIIEANLPVIDGSWSISLGAADELKVSIPLNTVEAKYINVRSATTPLKMFLAAIDGERILAAGWIKSRRRTLSNTLEVSARGILDYFASRVILPTSALTTPVNRFVVEAPDYAETGATVPNTALNTNFRNLTMRTIMRELLAQATAWRGGQIPLVLPPRDAPVYPGHEREYLGINFKNLAEALTQLSRVQDGVDFFFTPRLKPTKQGIEWVFDAGYPRPDARGVLLSPHRPDSSVLELEILEDASNVASLVWGTGGGQASEALVSRGYDQKLLNAGYPLIERVLSASETIVHQSTLDAHTRGALADAQASVEVWKLKIQAHPRYGVGLEQFFVGDFCDIELDAFDAATGSGDPYVPEAQTTRRRIMTIAGDTANEFVTIQTLEERA